VTSIQSSKTSTFPDVLTLNRDVDNDLDITLMCVTFKMTSIRGVDGVTVDMGDGAPPQRLVRPAEYDPTSDDRAPRVRRSAPRPPRPACPSLRPSSTAPRVSVAPPLVHRAPRVRRSALRRADFVEQHPPFGRRRRDVADMATIGQPFLLTYQYHTPGNYKYEPRILLRYCLRIVRTV